MAGLEKMSDILQENIDKYSKNWKPPKKEVKNCIYCGEVMEATKHEYPFRLGGKEEIHWNYEYKCPHNCEEKRKERKEYAKRYKIAKEIWNNAGLSRECVGWNLQKMTCENIEFLREYAENFGRFSKALILKGFKGTGKSLSSECIVKVLLHKGLSARITNMTELNIEINSALRNDKYEKYMEELMRYDLLVIDDFGREQYTTEKALENVFQLFNRLSKEHKPYIVSTNPEMLAIVAQKPQLDACIDRFRKSDRVKVLEFKNDSFRK